MKTKQKIFKNKNLQIFTSILEDNKNKTFGDIKCLYKKYKFLFNGVKDQTFLPPQPTTIDVNEYSKAKETLKKLCSLNYGNKQAADDIKYLNNYFFFGISEGNDKCSKDRCSIFYKNFGVFSKVYWCFLKIAEICKNNKIIHEIRNKTIRILIDDLFHHSIHEIALRQITTKNPRNDDEISIYNLEIAKINRNNQNNVAKMIFDILKRFIDSPFLDNIREATNKNIAHVMKNVCNWKYELLVPNNLFNAFESLYVLTVVLYFYISTNPYCCNNYLEHMISMGLEGFNFEFEEIRDKLK